MTPNQRHKAMAHNRGRTRPELAIAKALWYSGLRYLTDDGYKSRYGETLPGHPDLIFTRKRVAVFVDGCYWHGCPDCQKSAKQTDPFWLSKIQGTVERDKRNTEELERLGWKVVRVWEHQLKGKANLEQTAENLVQLLRNTTPA